MCMNRLYLKKYASLDISLKHNIIQIFQVIEMFEPLFLLERCLKTLLKPQRGPLGVSM